MERAWCRWIAREAVLAGGYGSLVWRVKMGPSLFGQGVDPAAIDGDGMTPANSLSSAASRVAGRVHVASHKAAHAWHSMRWAALPLPKYRFSHPTPLRLKLSTIHPHVYHRRVPSVGFQPHVLSGPIAWRIRAEILLAWSKSSHLGPYRALSLHRDCSTGRAAYRSRSSTHTLNET